MNKFKEREQQEILALLAQGMTLEEIAKKLHYAKSTISYRVQLLYAKFNVKNRHQLVLAVFKNIIIKKDNLIYSLKNEIEELKR